MHQFTGTLRSPQDLDGEALLTGRGRVVASDDGHSFPSLSSVSRMSDTMISYRHDTGALLNAEQGLTCAPGHVCPRVGAGRDERQDAFMALEDLWI
jgi:hypothetical protein